MNILELIREILGIAPNWEVSTKYEFYRHHLHEFEIDITDFSYIRTLESYLDEIEENKNLFIHTDTNSGHLIYVSDNLKLGTKAKRRYKKDYNKCYKSLEEMDNIDEELLTRRANSPKLLPGPLRELIEGTEDEEVMSLSITDKAKLVKESFAKRTYLMKLIQSNYSFEGLSGLFLFTKYDIDVVLTKVCVLSDNIPFITGIDYLYKNGNLTEGQERVLISFILFLLKKHRLELHSNITKYEYFTDTIYKDVRKHLYREINKEEEL